MLNLTSALNEQIRRLARREIRSQVKLVRRLTARHRRDLAELKRQIASIRKAVAFLERQERPRMTKQRDAVGAERVRFRPDGLKSHRARLGLSAADYGLLVGASGLSVYHWESGKTRPRKEQVAKLASVRGMGKREAATRLQLTTDRRSPRALDATGRAAPRKR